MFERDNLTPITGININVRENHSIWSENTPYGVLGRIIIKEGQNCIMVASNIKKSFVK